MRKKFEASSVENESSNQDQDQEQAITLDFVEPDDTIQKVEKSSRVKKMIDRVFVSTEEEEKQEKQASRRAKKSRFFVKHVYLVVGLLLFMINLLTPEEYKTSFTINEKDYSFLPSQEQLEEIVSPLARIADRHTKIADVNPDVTDVLISCNAVVAYGLELRMAIMLKHHLDKQQAEEEKKKRQYNPLKSLGDYNGIN